MLPSRHHAAAAPLAQAFSAAPARSPRRIQQGRALLLTTGDETASAADIGLCATLHRLGLQVEQAPSASGAGALLRHAELQGQPFALLIVRRKHAGLCGMNLAAALCLPLRKRPVTALCVEQMGTPDSLRGLGQVAVDVLIEDGAELFEVAENLLPHLKAQA